MTYQINGYTPSQGDIVWLNLNPTKGREMNKKRPVLVISRTIYNKRTGFIVVCPITSTEREDYISIPDEYTTHGFIDYLQMRSIDYTSKNREVTFIEKLSLDVFGQVAQRVESVFGFNKLF
jgi:mRNA interferase MazF